MNENGQPPMAAMAELLKCTSHGCKATVGIKQCSVPGCNKCRCISCVENLILKHGLEVSMILMTTSPYSSFLQQEMLWRVMSVINSVDDLQIPWNKDGKNGEDDPNNSMALLIKWLTKQGQYK